MSPSSLYTITKLTIVNHHRPAVDKDKHGNVQPFLHREEVHEQVVRYRLQVSVQRVEGMRSKGSRYNPLVVRLYRANKIFAVSVSLLQFSSSKTYSYLVQVFVDRGEM